MDSGRRGSAPGGSEDIRAVFLKVAGPDELIQEDEFLLMCKHKKVPLGETELRRMFVNMAQTGPNGDLVMDYRQFCTAVQRQKLVSSIVSKYNVEVEFVVPESYNYHKTTEENYAVEHKDFLPTYAKHRKFIDYTFHRNYSPERQAWQDAALQSIVALTKERSRPWLVYTSGPPGAGKSYALSWMSEHGYFPLENIVRIDPDHFKTMMPEWQRYREEKEKDGSIDPAYLCHKESGFIAELAQMAAMEGSQNVWVDTTLKDADWYSKKFDQYREDFPHYRIAIFTITAPQPKLMKRMEERALKTGRSVPEETVRMAIDSIDHAMQILTLKADLVANISNEEDGAAPVLKAVQMVNRFGSWNVIRQNFARKEPTQAEFPNSLAPVFLLKTNLNQSHIARSSVPMTMRQRMTPRAMDLETCAHLMCLQDLRVLVGEFPVVGHLDRILKSQVHIACSPRQQVNLDDASREVALIPDKAVQFCFLYPVFNHDQVVHAREHLDTNAQGLWYDPLVQLLSNGGFAYFAQNGDLIQINAMTTKRDVKLIQYGPPRPLPAVWDRHLQKQNRWYPTTLPFIRDAGATHFCWILPGEKPASAEAIVRFGGFAFRFKGSEPKYFAVASQVWDTPDQDDFSFTHQ